MKALYKAILFTSFFIGINAAMAPDGIKVGRTTVYVASPTIIRVTHSPSDTAPIKNSLIAKSDWPKAAYKTSAIPSGTLIETAALSIKVDKDTGKVTMLDAGDKSVLLAEETTSFRPGADKSYVVSQSFAKNSDEESLFGGGEYQNGWMDYMHETLQMIQFNTQAVVPFFVSSTGYGILWDNYAASYLNPPRQDRLLPFHTHTLQDPTGGNFNATASFTANRTGEHNLYVELHQAPSFGSGMGITLRMESGLHCHHLLFK